MPTPVPFADLLVSGYDTWFNMGLSGVLAGLLVLSVAGIVVRHFSTKN